MTSSSDATGEVRASRGSGRRTSTLRFLRDVALILLAAILISFLIKTFLVRSFYIPSPSMEQTLLVNDRILVNELVPDLVPIERGDVVVFEDPGGWLPAGPDVTQSPIEAFLAVIGITAPDSNDHLIKRVIGLPGDHVECCDDFGRIMINGVPIDEPYLAASTGTTAASTVEFAVDVPPDRLWVMGDNRGNSQDSRYHGDLPGKGFVPIDNVVGRAILVTWPIDRWQWIDNYSEVFVDVAE